MSEAKFVSINRGHRATLDDGSVWRVGANYAAMVFDWQPGDRIVITEAKTPVFKYRLTNLERQETANCLSSQRMGHWDGLPFDPTDPKNQRL